MKCLVTGGGGFLGLELVKQLVARGDEVRTFQRGKYSALEEVGAECVQGDLQDAGAVKGAVKGVEVVFHVAAKPGVWGTYQDFHGPNVVGTENVLAGCREAGVKYLVFTSSPSVVFNGQDENEITEAAPYPKRYLAHYPKTKAIAERMVMGTNGEGLRTVALRPHLIWGPGDPHLVPRVLARARMGRLSMIGKRKNLVDSTYIENAALAHVLAADALRGGKDGAGCAGKAYFISNGEPVPMMELIRMILGAANLQTVVPTINSRIAYAAGMGMEIAHRVLRLKHEPLITRFVAKQLSTAHWFDLSAARRDLGYEPRVTIAEGMERLAKALRETTHEVRV